MLTNLGRALTDLGDVDGAYACWEEALQIHERTGDLRWTSLVHLNLGSSRHADGETALGHLQEALHGFAVLGERRYEAISRGQLGLQQAHAGAFGEAESNFDAAEAILRALDDSFSLGRLLTKRGEACALAKDIASARAYLQSARELLQQTGATADSTLAVQVQRLADMVEKG